MSLNMLVYRVTDKKDLASPGETGDPFEAFRAVVSVTVPLIPSAADTTDNPG